MNPLPVKTGDFFLGNSATETGLAPMPEDIEATVRRINSQYFRSLSEVMERQLTGAAGRILKKAEAKIARLESRVAELESQVASLQGASNPNDIIDASVSTIEG